MDYRQLAEQYINYADALTERGKPEQAPLSILTGIAYALLHLAERIDASGDQTAHALGKLEP